MAALSLTLRDTCSASYEHDAHLIQVISIYFANSHQDSVYYQLFIHILGSFEHSEFLFQSIR